MNVLTISPVAAAPGSTDLIQLRAESIVGLTSRMNDDAALDAARAARLPTDIPRDSSQQASL
jgi:hypothetical protein